jgi:cytochrome oxidase Cu insertion factor (SCO1/SenC/PrrC family)
MQRVSVAMVALSAAVVLGAPVDFAQGRQAPAVDLSKLGPQVGERVPAFRLVDQAGATRDLTSIAGPKGAMLVFFRSADW